MAGLLSASLSLPCSLKRYMDGAEQTEINQVRSSSITPPPPPPEQSQQSQRSQPSHHGLPCLQVLELLQGHWPVLQQIFRSYCCRNEDPFVMSRATFAIFLTGTHACHGS